MVRGIDIGERRLETGDRFRDGTGRVRKVWGKEQRETEMVERGQIYPHRESSHVGHLQLLS